MSITEVSITAGEILLALEQRGGTLLVEDLMPSRRCSYDMTLMALGWLFKEGLVAIRPGIGGWRVRRREDQ
ncbi:MAG: hypothetical protein A3C53_08700 [Omnitrophica WOR_2 bacterium RIFCSPHIGHO2_02_FULL_68_15]|nr:MAG: hypothetical protein A3C53_08700 [Omnitrophica WOR_2 bacterium RIFCSPHIGHO2_02_FULL_68_15]